MHFSYKTTTIAIILKGNFIWQFKSTNFLTRLDSYRLHYHYIFLVHHRYTNRKSISIPCHFTIMSATYYQNAIQICLSHNSATAHTLYTSMEVAALLRHISTISYIRINTITRRLTVLCTKPFATFITHLHVIYGISDVILNAYCTVHNSFT